MEVRLYEGALRPPHEGDLPNHWKQTTKVPCLLADNHIVQLRFDMAVCYCLHALFHPTKYNICEIGKQVGVCLTNIV